ncbi:MAG: glycoside hydrolase family 130 protein [Tagaea sp.]|nr:glycoside hydrolase family 130 protein [Tagaea sp.]
MKFYEAAELRLRPDPARVVVRPFRPATEPRDLTPLDKTRAGKIVERVLALDPDRAAAHLAHVIEDFDGRHRDLPGTLDASAAKMGDALPERAAFGETHRRLIGAYFLHEYAFGATALFNPSIVPHPDRSDSAPGSSRFVLSLRAVGEGHVSSLTFRAGTIDADGAIVLDPIASLATLPLVTARDITPEGEAVSVAFGAETAIGERVVFPVTASQSNGIEDARFVRFADGAATRFLATYTAYSGRAIRSELIETADFREFRMTPLRGNAALNKGMALFPRRVDGRFAMIARHDNENLHLVLSDDLHVWEGGRFVLGPRHPWEFVQIGNCGSPIELDEGWLLLIHGVGPMRKYAIGAALLDKADPSIVLARTREPLIRPEMFERNGYVPNVVYTCGALRHGDDLIVPFAISDTYTRFARMPIAELLASLRGGG